MVCKQGLSFNEPANVEEALKDVDWVNAMHEELNISVEIKFRSHLRD